MHPPKTNKCQMACPYLEFFHIRKNTPTLKNNPPRSIKIIPFMSIVFTNCLIPISANHPINKHKNTSKFE